MTEFIAALAVAFDVVFFAELGDKAQLLALGFGTGHSLRTVAIGLTIGYAAANVIAVVVGGIVGAALPERAAQIVGGIVFLGFAAATVWRREPDDIDDLTTDTVRPAMLAVIGSIAVSIAVAEMGDKTQIATATLASQSSPVGVWIGATLGAASCGIVGAVAGKPRGRSDSRTHDPARIAAVVRRVRCCHARRMVLTGVVSPAGVTTRRNPTGATPSRLGQRRLASTALTKRSNTASGWPMPLTTTRRF